MSTPSQADIDLCTNEANAFFDIAGYCNDLDIKAQSSQVLFASDAFYFFPAIVNLSFAVELYLKSLIIKACGQYRKTHGLHQLFCQLPSVVQEDLSDRFSAQRQYPVSLSETLEIHDKAFEMWRYAFETKNSDVEACFDNLRTAAEVLREKLQSTN